MTMEELASQVEILLSFAGTLIPEKETIRKALIECNDKSNFALSAAPLLLAHGIDYEQPHFEAQLRARRAKALYELLDVLEKTESERIERQCSQLVVEQNRKALQSILG